LPKIKAKPIYFYSNNSVWVPRCGILSGLLGFLDNPEQSQPGKTIKDGPDKEGHQFLGEISRWRLENFKK